MKIKKKLIKSVFVLAAPLGVLASEKPNTSATGIEDLQSAVQMDTSVTSIYQRNVKGGLDTSNRNGEFSGSYDIELDIDMKKLMDWEGSFFIHGEGGWTDSEGINDHSVGSFFGVNADAVGNRSLDIVEAFYQIDSSESLSITIGKIDFTGFFDGNAFANDESSQFLNGALVNNAAIPFPDYSLGAIAALKITDEFSVQLGVADAQADGRETGFNTAFNGDKYYFYTAEAAINTEIDNLAGTYRLGVWNDPKPKASADFPDESRDDTGFYAGFDQVVLKENPSSNGDCQGLGVFFRYGYADLKRNDMTHFYSFGGQYKGLLEGRDEDVLAVGFAKGAFSDYSDQTYPEGYEAVIETYYKAKITSKLSLSPDFQYVISPAEGGSDAVVLGLRMQYHF